MKSILGRLHRWQLITVLPETIWSFPIRHGYESFSRQLSTDVQKVSKQRFQQPFDYSFSRKPYGYWDEREVFIRSKTWPKGLLALLSSARRSHFEGAIVQSGEGTQLVGSYKLAGHRRLFILLLIYAPLALALYGLLIFPFLAVQRLQNGNMDALLMDSVMFPVTVLGSLVFWAAGYLSGRIHIASTKHNRDIIYELLKRASA